LTDKTDGTMTSGTEEEEEETNAFISDKQCESNLEMIDIISETTIFAS
jgi:hypothetical protein